MPLIFLLSFSAITTLILKARLSTYSMTRISMSCIYITTIHCEKHPKQSTYNGATRSWEIKFIIAFALIENVCDGVKQHAPQTNIVSNPSLLKTYKTSIIRANAARIANNGGD